MADIDFLIAEHLLRANWHTQPVILAQNGCRAEVIYPGFSRPILKGVNHRTSANPSVAASIDSHQGAFKNPLLDTL